MCLSMGGADVILSLPGSCYFAGNNGLVTIALRRMLEDEATLQAMMETEIRSQVTILFKKQHRGSIGSGQQPRASMKPFMQAITPLVCRSPLIFVRAIACSVRLEPKGDQSSSLASSRDARVVLLTNEERAKTTKAIGPISFHKDNVTVPHKKASSQSQDDKVSHKTRGRSKSPHNKKDKPDHKKQNLDGSPPNHITSLLLSRILVESGEGSHLSPKRPFLLKQDYLDILSDLILAIPSCGAAVHRYKLPTDMRVHHALAGCPDPPQTAVSFLLHNLITLPRTKSLSLKGDTKSNSKSPEQKLDDAKARTSQSSARLIVTLVARSGEGRR